MPRSCPTSTSIRWRRAVIVALTRSRFALGWRSSPTASVTAAAGALHRTGTPPRWRRTSPIVLIPFRFPRWPVPLILPVVVLFRRRPIPSPLGRRRSVRLVATIRTGTLARSVPIRRRTAMSMPTPTPITAATSRRWTIANSDRTDVGQMRRTAAAALSAATSADRRRVGRRNRLVLVVLAGR